MRCLGLTLWQVIRFISILSCMTIHCSVLAHNMAKASCPVSIWMSSWEQWIPRHLHIAYLFGKSLLCAMCVCWHAWRHIWMGHSSCALQCNLQVPGNFTLVWHLPPLNLARQIHSGAHCDHPVRSVELSGPHYTFMKSSFWGTWLWSPRDIVRQKDLSIFYFYNVIIEGTIARQGYVAISSEFPFLSNTLFCTSVHIFIFSCHPVVIAFM